MIIKAIKAVSVKGKTFHDKLTPITMLVGKNGAGKTSRMDTIRLALTGRVPGLGGTNASIWKLSSGPSMSIAVEFDVGTITGEWKRVGESVSGGRTIPKDFPVLPDILFDPKTYFSLSPEKRIQFAFDAMRISADTFDTAELVSKLKLIKCEDHNKDHQIVLDDIVKQISDSAAGGKRAKLPIQEWIAKEIADMTDGVKLARASADRMAKTAAGMVQLDSRNAIKLSMNGLDTEYESLNKRLIQAHESLFKLNALEDSSKSKAELIQKFEKLLDSVVKLQAIRLEIDRLSNVVDGFKSRTEDGSAAIATAEAKLATSEALVKAAHKVVDDVVRRADDEKEKERKRGELKLIIDTIPDQSKVILQLESNIRRATDEVNEYKSLTDGLRSQQNEAKNTWSILQEKASEIRRQIKKVKAEKDSFNGLKECPTCFACSDNWQERATSKLVEQIVELSGLLDDLALTQGTVSRRKEQLEKEIAASLKEDKRISDLHKSIGPIRDSLAKSERQHSQRKQSQILLESLGQPIDTVKLLDEADIALRAANVDHKARQTLRNKIKEEYIKALDEQTQHSANQTLLTKLRKELSQLERDSDEANRLKEAIAAITVSDPEDIKRQVAQSKKNLDDLEAKQEANRTSAKQCAASLQSLAIKEQSAEERRKTEAELAVRKASLIELQAFRNNMVDAAFVPLLKTANTIAGPFLPAPLEYRNEELGMMRNGSWATDATLSGAEQAYVYVSLAVALAVDSPCKIVLMDCLGEIDDTVAFLSHINELIGHGVIDQFVGCDRNIERYDSISANSVSVIKL